MKESAVEKILQMEAVKAGGISYKLAPTVVGMPDRMVIHKGVIYLVELKTETGRLSPGQKLLHNRLRAHGVEPIVLYGAEEVRTWVRSTLTS